MAAGRRGNQLFGSDPIRRRNATPGRQWSQARSAAQRERDPRSRFSRPACAIPRSSLAWNAPVSRGPDADLMRFARLCLAHHAVLDGDLRCPTGHRPERWLVVDLERRAAPSWPLASPERVTVGPELAGVLAGWRRAA